MSGERQVEGVDYFEKWAPTVSWATVRMLLCLTLSQGWVTKQADFLNDFVQATLKEDVYMSLPEGFEIEGGEDPSSSYALKLNKSLYGLVQSPMYWFLHLRDNLEFLRLKQSRIDPCLFYGDGMCVLIFVDDCLFLLKILIKSTVLLRSWNNLGFL